jgi:TolB protein
MNKFLASLGVVLALGATAVRAEFVVEVTRGQSEAIPIAIVPFAASDVTAASLDVAQLVNDDLSRSGRFRTMDRKDMIDQPHNGAGIRFDDWRRLNNDYMLVGTMQPQGGDKFVITYELYNVLTHQRLLGFEVTAYRGKLREEGHKIADAVFEKILGIRGAFNTWIAYVAVLGHVPNKSYQLIVADSDGENKRVVRISNDPIMSPAWSPDGSKLAYVWFDKHLSNIVVQTLETGESQKVSEHAGVNQAPAWSPDGRKLALTLSTRDGNLDIYVKDLATQALSRITDDPGIDTEPQWSNDGESLYFTSDRAGGPQIYKVGIKPGDKPRRITFQGSYNARPRLSPDESQLSFVTQEEGAYRIANMDLKAAHGEVQVLTKGRFDVSPSYAPNGAVLIYASRDKGRGVLGTVSADGRVSSILAVTDGELQEPAWAPF